MEVEYMKKTEVLLVLIHLSFLPQFAQKKLAIIHIWVGYATVGQ